MSNKIIMSMSIGIIIFVFLLIIVWIVVLGSVLDSIQKQGGIGTVVGKVVHDFNKAANGK